MCSEVRHTAYLALMFCVLTQNTPACAEPETLNIQSSVTPSATQEDAPRLPFTEALEQAWQLDPARREYATSYKGAKARARAANSWFAGGPVVSGSYYDDHAIGTNIGYTTYQGEISVPLWLPGQRGATHAVALAAAETAVRQTQVAHMATAVRLLDATAALLIARRQITSARNYYEAALQISNNITHATHLGEMTQADQELSDASLNTARTEYATAQEETQATLTQLETVLGSAQVPDIGAFTQTDSMLVRMKNLDTVENNDPRVQEAKQESKEAQEAMKLVRRSFMPNPEIGVGAIHEEQYGSPWDTRVGINFSMPLPSAVRNTPQFTAARDRLSATDRQEIMTRRMVRQEIVRIRARLLSATTIFRSASSAAASLERRASQLERAWRLHETSLDDALRARQAAYTSALARDKAEILWHVTIIRAMIATGTLPGLASELPVSVHHNSATAASSVPQQRASAGLIIPAESTAQ